MNASACGRHPLRAGDAGVSTSHVHPDEDLARELCSVIERDSFEVFVDKRILAREKWRDEINGLWPNECRLRQPRSSNSRHQSRYGGVSRLPLHWALHGRLPVAASGAVGRNPHRLTLIAHQRY
jgi:hypothetical protein